jgi:hypothetical protein
MISDSLGAVWAVESMRPRDISALMIFESLVAVWAVESLGRRAISSFMISESLGAVWAVESLRRPCYQFIDDFSVPRGCLGCRILA